MSERPFVSVEDALIVTIDEALREHSLGVLRFLELERERRAWNCSYRQARHAYDDWISPDRPHAFDVRALPNVLRIVGNAEWLSPLLALESRVMRERRRSEPQHEPTRTRARR